MEPAAWLFRQFFLNNILFKRLNCLSYKIGRGGNAFPSGLFSALFVRGKSSVLFSRITTFPDVYCIFTNYSLDVISKMMFHFVFFQIIKNQQRES